MGVMGATSVTCGVGLVLGTAVWCDLGSIWLLVIPIACIFGLVVGVPLSLFFSKLKVGSWWAYGLAGAAASLPSWLVFAQPFVSTRWLQSGLYDTLNCFGTGVMAALIFRMLLTHALVPTAGDAPAA